MNAMLELRMVAAKIHGPSTAAGWEHRLLRIAASSQGGLAIVAIPLFSVESLSLGPGRTGPASLANVGFSSTAAEATNTAANSDGRQPAPNQGQRVEIPAVRPNTHRPLQTPQANWRGGSASFTRRSRCRWAR